MTDTPHICNKIESWLKYRYYLHIAQVLVLLTYIPIQYDYAVKKPRITITEGYPTY